MTDENKSQRKLWNSISEWWSRQGNRVLPLNTPNSLLYLMDFLVTGIFSLIFLGGTIIVSEVIIQKELTVEYLQAIGLFIINTIVISFVALYIRKMTAYTFKNYPKMRRDILARDDLSSFFFLSFEFVLTGIYLVVLAALLIFTLSLELLKNLPNWSDVSTLLLDELSILFPFLCSSGFFFLIFGILTNLGVGRSEKLVGILEILVESRRDERHLAGKFAKTLGELVLNIDVNIREVDLGRHLSPILLAFFWGSNQEKSKAKDMLLQLQEALKEEEPTQQARVINWLSKSEDALPRLAKLKETIKLRWTARRGIFSATPESLKYVATIATIVSAILSAISLISYFM